MMDCVVGRDNGFIPITIQSFSKLMEAKASIDFVYARK